MEPAPRPAGEAHRRSIERLPPAATCAACTCVAKIDKRSKRVVVSVLQMLLQEWGRRQDGGGPT